MMRGAEYEKERIHDAEEASRKEKAISICIISFWCLIDGSCMW